MGACCSTNRPGSALSPSPSSAPIDPRKTDMFKFKVQVFKGMLDKAEFVHSDVADELSLDHLFDQLNAIHGGFRFSHDGGVVSVCGLTDNRVKSWQLELNGSEKPLAEVLDYAVTFDTAIVLRYTAVPDPHHKPT
eukprot:comp10134_c0_seq1/m.12061 comp10134_c0_seq1/g.12061  ORF comp10134_c0_seq1/g.12061 comp10134_c0_seq1/m.12061 type:complete len:135 (+) comp10134_c0_seq1:24-428(+)